MPRKAQKKVELLSNEQALDEIQLGKSMEPDAGSDAWRHFFQPYIDKAPLFVNGPFFWEVFSFRGVDTCILDVGGAYDQITPFSYKQFLNLKPEELFSIFHPDDLPHVLTFIAKIVDFLLKCKPTERENFHVTIYGRVKNASGDYAWNALSYPAFYFDTSGNIMYGLVVYTDISHIISGHQQPMLTILDRTTGITNQVVTCYYPGKEQKALVVHPVISKREKEVLNLLADGLASKEIAASLGIAKNTVENHRQRLLKKFNAASSIELLKKINRLNKE